LSSSKQNGAENGSERHRAASENEAQPRNKPLGFRLTLDPAHPYLATRGIGPELIELFGLGFCAKGSMAGRVCIPIHNASGELVAYVGRFVGSEHELPADEEKYKLPAGFHKTLELWNLHRVRHCKHLIVVEGYFGAMRLHGLRLPAVALMGSSISEEQIALLRDCPVLRHVTVMLDGDEAGQKAGDIIVARLAKHWWARIVLLPDETQPDTVERSVLEQLLGRL
jgi:DNA primase